MATVQFDINADASEWHSDERSHRLMLAETISVRVIKGCAGYDADEWVVICDWLGFEREIQQPGNVKEQALEMVISRMQSLTYDIQQALKTLKKYTENA